MLDQLAAPGMGSVASSSPASRPSPGGWPTASLDPSSGDTDIGSRREQVRDAQNREPGECLWEGDVGLGWAVG